MPAAPDHSAEPSSTTPGSAPTGQTPLFHERVMPGPGLWIAAVTLGAALGLILVPLSLPAAIDRKSTRLNSSHVSISYAVFCLEKKREPSIHPVQIKRAIFLYTARGHLMIMLVAAC